MISVHLNTTSNEQEIAMAIPEGKHQISMVIDKEVYDDLVRIGKKLDMPVSKVARNVLYSGMDNVKLFEGIGLMKAIKLYRRFNKFINEESFWVGQGGKTLHNDK